MTRDTVHLQVCSTGGIARISHLRTLLITDFCMQGMTPCRGIEEITGPLRLAIHGNTFRTIHLYHPAKAVLGLVERPAVRPHLTMKKNTYEQLAHFGHANQFNQALRASSAFGTGTP